MLLEEQIRSHQYDLLQSKHSDKKRQRLATSTFGMTKESHKVTYDAMVEVKRDVTPKRSLIPCSASVSPGCQSTVPLKPSVEDGGIRQNNSLSSEGQLVHGNTLVEQAQCFLAAFPEVTERRVQNQNSSTVFYLKMKSLAEFSQRITAQLSQQTSKVDSKAVISDKAQLKQVQCVITDKLWLYKAYSLLKIFGRRETKLLMPADQVLLLGLLNSPPEAIAKQEQVFLKEAHRKQLEMDTAATAEGQYRKSRTEAILSARQKLCHAQLPLAKSSCTILHFGDFLPGPDDTFDCLGGAAVQWQNYHNMKFLYPVGLRTQRKYFSVRDPKTRVIYESSIELGEKGPIFVLTHPPSFHSDGRTAGQIVYKATSPSRAWMDMVTDLNTARQKQGLPTRTVNEYGAERFGLNVFAHYLEGMKGIEHCDKYIFLHERGKNTRIPCQFANRALNNSRKVETLVFSPCVLGRLRRLYQLRRKRRVEKSAKGTPELTPADRLLANSSSSGDEDSASHSEGATRRQLNRRSRYKTQFSEVEERPICSVVEAVLDFKKLRPMLVNIVNKINDVVKVVPTASGGSSGVADSAALELVYIDGLSEMPHSMYVQILTIYEDQLASTSIAVFQAHLLEPSKSIFTIAVRLKHQVVAAATCVLLTVYDTKDQSQFLFVDITSLAVLRGMERKGLGTFLVAMLRSLAATLSSGFATHASSHSKPGVQVVMLAKASSESSVWWGLQKGFLPSLRDLSKTSSFGIPGFVKRVCKEVMTNSRQLGFLFDHRLDSVIWCCEIDRIALLETNVEKALLTLLQKQADQSEQASMAVAQPLLLGDVTCGSA